MAGLFYDPELLLCVSVRVYLVTKTVCYPWKGLVSSAVCTAPELGLCKFKPHPQKPAIQQFPLKPIFPVNKIPKMEPVWPSLKFPMVSKSKKEVEAPSVT